MLVRVGTGALTTLSVIAEDVPPAGAGLTAVMERLPAAEKSEEGSAALTWVELMKVVVRAEPFTSMTVEGSNPAPKKVMTADAEPASAVLTDIKEMTGVGLSTSRSIVVLLPVVPFDITTGSWAPFVSYVAGTVAVSWLALT